jgi:tRNA dimethylallyltransferase
MDSADVSPAKRAILIAGPTASGKSALALALAEQHGGVVINADSMQVYADLTILTARPSSADRARAPHRLFGHIDAADAYSVGRWLHDMQHTLSEVAAAGLCPVIVGGTGLYFKALTEGLSEMPQISAEVRERLRVEARAVPAAALHARLAMLDPDMAARLRPTDPQRILRAIEVFETTGRSLLFYQQRRAPAVLPSASIAAVFLDLPRPVLNARIDERFDRMIAGGALDEVTALANRRLDPTLPAMRALGVPHLLEAVGRVDRLAPAIAAAKLASRQYAKRQVTYARHQLPGFTWAAPADGRAIVERQLATADLSVRTARP